VSCRTLLLSVVTGARLLIQIKKVRLHRQEWALDAGAACGKFPFYRRNKLLVFKARERGMEGMLQVIE
jgi:hypothetical protein